MPIFWMPHDVREGRPRLGSLDFLRTSPGKGTAQFMHLFPDPDSDPATMSGAGERIHDAFMPEECDLVIANPPSTRAGGPGSAEDTDWNHLFGSVLSKSDSEIMQQALKETLNPTPGSLYAGLGSAFLVLGHERLRMGGRLAFVLPATALTGSRWVPIRQLLLDHYRIDWVVVSHDPRSRTARRNLPGRRFVAFSESTRIAGALIVATRVNPSATCDGSVRFVNLRRNPDEPIDAIGLTRALMAVREPESVVKSAEVTLGSAVWGETRFVAQNELDARPWPHVAFVQSRLVDVAPDVRSGGLLRTHLTQVLIHRRMLWEMCELGPSEMQIKNPSRGLFEVAESEDPARAGHPAMWHHKSNRIVSLQTAPDTRLRERADRGPSAQEAMLARGGRLQIARELGHAPQRLAAVLTTPGSLGVRSWITVLPKNPGPGKEEALCLWLDSTLGLILRIVVANRPYLGRSVVHHELLRALHVLDVDALSSAERAAATRVFDDLKTKKLTGFAHVATDPVRRELDHRLSSEVLGVGDISDTLDDLASDLNNEPTLTARH